MKSHNINAQSLLSTLCVLIIGFECFVRSFDWIMKPVNDLYKASPMYIHIQNHVSIQSLGWTLLVSSILIIVSTFFKGYYMYACLAAGGILGSVVNLIYGVIVSDVALLYSTYYNALILACCQVILFAIGVVGLWKHN